VQGNQLHRGVWKCQKRNNHFPKEWASAVSTVDDVKRILHRLLDVIGDKNFVDGGDFVRSARSDGFDVIEETENELSQGLVVKIATIWLGSRQTELIRTCRNRYHLEKGRQRSRAVVQLGHPLETW
jgi:hypothetical protein